jgi:hypothetical protein
LGSSSLGGSFSMPDGSSQWPNAYSGWIWLGEIELSPTRKIGSQ